MASCACGLTWRMMRRASQIATEALQLCTMMSGSPNIAQPSPNWSERGAKLSCVIVLVDCSIAIDPIKYIRIPFSFDDFKPDSNIIDNDGMPGKPSSPAGSVFGSFSHFVILSFWFADKAHRRAPCWRPSRSSCELNFFSFRSSLILHREITGAMPACAMRPSMQPWVTISLVLNLGSRHGRSAAGQAGVDSVRPRHHLFTSRVPRPAVTYRSAESSSVRSPSALLRHPSDSLNARHETSSGEASLSARPMEPTQCRHHREL